MDDPLLKKARLQPSLKFASEHLNGSEKVWEEQDRNEQDRTTSLHWGANRLGYVL